MIPEFVKKTYDLLGKNKIIEDALTTSYTEDDHIDAFMKQLQKEFKAKYKTAKKINDLAEFHIQAINIVMAHFAKTEFYKNTDLMREIKYLMHYIFYVMQDDFFIGEKVFKENLTRFDDYIFSKYRKNDLLYKNIKRLTSLAFSNRFDKKPKDNILGYFVFIEENGIERIDLLQDYYKMLEKSQSKSLFKFKFKENYTKEKIKSFAPEDFATVESTVWGPSVMNKFNIKTGGDNDIV